MKTISIKRTSSIFLTELKTKIRPFAIWMASIVGLTFLYMLLFPMVKDIALAKLEAMPPEILAMFGMEDVGQVMNYNYYFGMIYQLFSIVFCGYAVAQGASIFQSEETSGIIEYLYSNNVSREEIFVAKSGTVLTRIFILSLCALIPALISGAAVADNELSIKTLILCSVITLVAMLFYASLGFLLGSVLKRNRPASGIGLGILLAMYFIGYTSELVEDLEFFKWLSPTHMLSPQDVINSTWGVGTAVYNPLGLILLSCLAVIFIVTAFLLYKRKDLQ
ncbi:MAG TPA: ABC transporter permease subunit [Clostridia bacterium]|nr:ABC transporter permease subunit [Clostridia bacterium]